MIGGFRNNCGFTLIELLMVVAIIGILSAVAMPVISSYRMRAYNGAAMSDIKSVRTNLEAFYVEKGRYPW